MEAAWLVLPGVILWAGVLVLPWQPWRIRETLEADGAQTPDLPADLSDVTVLIPARNEAEVIAETLLSVAAQGKRLKIILVDDQSTDGTAAEAARLNLDTLTIICGQPPEPGWSGKLWALHQGLAQVKTGHILLLDADIRLQAGLIPALRAKLHEHKLHLVSLLAQLSMQSFQEKLLIPAFVYFFKLLYPFQLSNSGSRRVAAAAGGCILLRTESLAQVGGFEAIRGELIDDCALARQFRNAGLSTWVGLSRSALSRRRYDRLGGIWNMVARTAFTQLRYSPWLLALCSVLLVVAFPLPALGLLSADTGARLLGGCAILLMMASYLPTLRYYAIHPLWSLALPLAGTLYLLMTWDSARRYRTGIAARWKNRSYGRDTAAPRPL